MPYIQLNEAKCFSLGASTGCTPTQRAALAITDLRRLKAQPLTARLMEVELNRQLKSAAAFDDYQRLACQLWTPLARSYFLTPAEVGQSYCWWSAAQLTSNEILELDATCGPAWSAFYLDESAAYLAESPPTRLSSFEPALAAFARPLPEPVFLSASSAKLFDWRIVATLLPTLPPPAEMADLCGLSI